MSGAPLAFLLSPLALDWATLVFTVAVILLAAVVRGYSGFGFSAIVVTGLTLALPPAEVVPIALLLEIAASLGMLRYVRTEISWHLVRWLLLGAALGMPAGFLLLGAVPADAMRVVISLLVLALSLLIWCGFRLRGASGGGGTFATGVVSGVANGSAAIGGLPVVVFLLSTATGAAMTRATLIFYFMVGDIYGTAVAATHGLVVGETLARAGVLLLPLYLGVALGNRRFLKSPPETFRRLALLLLMALSVLGLLRAVVF